MTSAPSAQPGGHEGESLMVEETGQGAFQVQVTTGARVFLVDEPLAAGGLGSGPNPYDLLSAAIGSCSLMTMRMYARRKQWPLERIRVKITHKRQDLRSKDEFVKEIELHGPLTEEQRSRILEIAARCPVHMTLERGSKIETILAPRETLGDATTTRCDHARDMSIACDD